eukprot:2619389-Amphidinium_carterae.1
MIRDHIAAFARAAGLYTQVEQVVDPQLAESIGAAAVPTSEANAFASVPQPAASEEASTTQPAATQAPAHRQGRRP